MNSELYFKDPEPDVLVRPSNDTIIMESHGSRLYLRLQLPAFRDMESTCPVVLMLHGYPGNERNFDLGQTLRMAGLATVQFSYRGVWGSHGEYSFSHIIEDTLAVAEHIRSHADEYRINPDRLYVFGHSMGGFAAVNSISQGLKAAGAVILSPCDMACKYLYRNNEFQVLMESQKNGYFNTPTETYLEEDVSENAEKWLFVNAADYMDTDIAYKFIGGTRDQLTPAEVHIRPIMEKLRSRGADVTYIELDDGHDYPASRVRLTKEIVDFIAEIEKQ